jgi:hypothetical protein
MRFDEELDIERFAEARDDVAIARNGGVEVGGIVEDFLRIGGWLAADSSGAARDRAAEMQKNRIVGRLNADRGDRAVRAKSRGIELSAKRCAFFDEALRSEVELVIAPVGEGLAALLRSDIARAELVALDGELAAEPDLLGEVELRQHDGGDAEFHNEAFVGSAFGREFFRPFI